MAHAFSLRVCMHCRRRVKNVPCREMRGCTQAIEGAAIESPGCAGVFIRSAPLAVRLFPGSNFTISYCFCLLFLLFLSVEKQAAIRRVVRVVEGAALEIVPAIWNTPWRKSLFFKASRALKRLEPLAFSPGFLSNLQGENQGGNIFGAVSKWSQRP